jgi:hypothetical protein
MFGAGAVALVVALVLVSSLMLVAAQETDGRVNPVDHVGGAAIYCVDETFTPAANWNDGGIRVLDAAGQELLFAPAADIIAAGEPPEATVAVGSGANAFGGLTLYVRPDTKFVLTGVDEHGKDFEFVWAGCGYSMPADVPEVTPEPTDNCIRRAGDDAALSPDAVIDPCIEDT